MKKLILILIVAAAILTGCENERCKCYKVDVEIEYFPNHHIISADTSRVYFKDCDCDGVKENVVLIHNDYYSGSTYTQYYCD